MTGSLVYSWFLLRQGAILVWHFFFLQQYFIHFKKLSFSFARVTLKTEISAYQPLYLGIWVALLYFLERQSKLFSCSTAPSFVTIQ